MNARHCCVTRWRHASRHVFYLWLWVLYPHNITVTSSGLLKVQKCNRITFIAVLSMLEPFLFDVMTPSMFDAISWRQSIKRDYPSYEYRYYITRVQFGDPYIDRHIEYQSAMVYTGIYFDAYRHLFSVMDDVTGVTGVTWHNFDDISYDVDLYII